METFFVGLDVGSTTVKAIVVDAATDASIRQDLSSARDSPGGEGVRVSAMYGSGIRTSLQPGGLDGRLCGLPILVRASR
jgi:hypothetical protein